MKLSFTRLFRAPRLAEGPGEGGLPGQDIVSYFALTSV